MKEAYAGDYDHAILDFSKAIEIRPDDEDVIGAVAKPTRACTKTMRLALI